jgi:hypothetical protein
MTVSIRNKLDNLPAMERGVNENKSAVNVQEEKGNSITFETFLKNAVSSASSLDKGQINVLLFMLKMQMNERLFSVIADDENNSDLNRPMRGLMNLGFNGYLPEPTASKKLHQPQKNDNINPSENIDGIINQAAERFSVDPDLIRGVIKAESNFKNHSTSSKGAMGLMQLMPSTARDLGVNDPYNPYENIMGGTRYLKGLLDRYGGDVDRALAAYNWGMGNVEKHPDRLPRETRTYISRIKQYYFEAKA